MCKIVFGRTLLFVEDDDIVRKELASYFKKRGNIVYEADCLKQAKNLISHHSFDGIVLDIILPDGEGLELFSLPSLPPIIILSNLNSDHDVLEGFQHGALDYVIKPTSPEILEARLSLRMLPKEQAKIVLHGLKIDITERTTNYGNTPITLTSSEFNILVFLMKNSGKYYTADEIYEKVWNMPSLKSTTIKYHISNLRQKLIKSTGKNLILTAFGKGYAFLAAK